MKEDVAPVSIIATPCVVLELSIVIVKGTTILFAEETGERRIAKADISNSGKSSVNRDISDGGAPSGEGVCVGGGSPYGAS